MQKVLREPLFHFLLIGAAIFGVYHFVATRSVVAPDEIVVTQGRIESLSSAFQLKWQRPPTPIELDALIKDYVREEACAREAIAMGLDKDDSVIRNRLRQKLEFVSQDLLSVIDPTDEQLTAWLNSHPDDFLVPNRFTFRQVYLNPQKHGDHLEQDATALLANLQQKGPNADVSALGDSLLLDSRYESMSLAEVKKQFGDKFVTALTSVETGQWQGPIQSGYGVHIVLLEDCTKGRLPVLDEVRTSVRRDWMSDRKSRATEELYESLIQRYIVKIETPATSSGSPAIAKASP